MSNIHDEIVKEITNNYDQLILNCFKRCGIELDLKDLDKWKGRIEAFHASDYIYPVEVDEWYLDGKLLFKIIRYYAPVMDDDRMQYRMEVRYDVDFRTSHSEECVDMKGELND